MTETATTMNAAEPAAEERDEFRPVADYGLLADCNSAALVSRDGSIDWLCLPRYDSPAVFSRLLDPKAGHWSIQPPGALRGAPLPARHARHRDHLHHRRAAACACSMRWPSPRDSAATTSDSTHRTSSCAPWRASPDGSRCVMELAPRGRVRACQAAVPSRGERRPNLRRARPRRRPRLGRRSTSTTRP